MPKKEKNPNTSAKAIWIKCAILLSLISTNANAYVKNENDNDPMHTQTELEFKNFSQSLENEAFKQRVIRKIADKKKAELSQQVMDNIDNLQADITKAKQQGKRNQRVKALFSEVFENNHFSGKENYCAAGATSAYENVTDSLMNMVLKNILVSTEATPKDLNLFSHPNVSCPAFCAYYKAKLGNNYIDRSTKDYRAIFKNQLEPGDILMLKSSQNTSSGMHCVTFDRYDEKGRIWVKSLNNESNYSVDLLRIVSAAKIPSQFKDELIDQLEQKPELLTEMIAQDEELKSQAILLQSLSTNKTVDMYALAFSPGKDDIHRL